MLVHLLREFFTSHKPFGCNYIQVELHRNPLSVWWWWLM